MHWNPSLKFASCLKTTHWLRKWCLSVKHALHHYVTIYSTPTRIWMEGVTAADCIAFLTFQRCGAVVPPGRVCSGSSTWPLSLQTSPASPEMLWPCARTQESSFKWGYLSKWSTKSTLGIYWGLVWNRCSGTCNSRRHRWLYRIQWGPHPECRRQS